VDVPSGLAAAILAFNFAVWKFRKPAQAARLVQSSLWLVDKITELARFTLLLFKPPKRKTKNAKLSRVSLDEHEALLVAAGPDTVIAYTDGSASPNPGPSGGAASIFFQPETFVDCGCSLGHGSNNRAELYALGVCLMEVREICVRFPLLKRVLIFSDSKLALNAATSRKRPLANGDLVASVRKFYTALVASCFVGLHWIPGHAGVGGNERVDRIAKLFASNHPTHKYTPQRGFEFTSTQGSWPFFPLCSAPLHLFTSKISPPSSTSVSSRAKHFSPSPVSATSALSSDEDDCLDFKHSEC
jgi:ribonuclease HI